MSGENETDIVTTAADKARIDAVSHGRDILNVFSDKWHAEVVAVLYGYPEGLSGQEVQQIILSGMGEAPRSSTQVSAIMRNLEKIYVLDYGRADVLSNIMRGRLTEVGKALFEGWIETTINVNDLRLLVVRQQAEEMQAHRGSLREALDSWPTNL